ncbi:uncharacterized protein L3040_002925 [Drepanopeziza brunnea f. sp. 'multigermtubi']|uniref:Crossover junction endonuclease MUS81 n=1 Tax=Marssonina brunnea f. sp. multigermtubi (strain MB_m1) TaxID=1072389 RepID=K1W7P4_MARBU|nr:ERCC4 domain-containing protein [Drepanopeziza brunnea f. sp. 'multigermtubi' MB_m1]EKD13125.1 ERCC4 domain-containing protein [Drepanopeziza brunnea f. sp. 'multigermtubi' MB_m1]KAJ5047082.1 hypothetical protein L3040_002925 [Drepanopeziza brunnea f. sp. 'multigermtubi']
MPSCANPLWLTFVEEWVATAIERNTKGIQTYKKARTSLKECPLPMQHPSETQALKFWGDKLVQKLTKELEDWCSANDQPMPERPNKRKKKSAGSAAAATLLAGISDDEDDAPSPPKKTRKTTSKPYFPKYQSGPYALIIGLATLDRNSRDGLSKADLIERAQPHCESSFTETKGPGQFYTAWNSMKTLEEKDLVYAKGRPTRYYMLTEDGWEVANRMLKTADPTQGRVDKFVYGQKDAAVGSDAEDGEPTRVNGTARVSAAAEILDSPKKPDRKELVPDGKPISKDTDLPHVDPIILEPGSFTVELIVDNREIKSQKNRDHIQVQLKKKGIDCMSRSLALGDFLWVAKMHDPNLLERQGAEGSEIVLDYIIERKRLDDLIMSIKDKRFLEQKFRLRKSGIKNVIYIIEEAKIEVGGFEQHVASAIASTQVVNGFFVKKTQTMEDTINYLLSITRLLKAKYESRPLHLIPTKIITSQNYLPLQAHLAKTQPSTYHYITYEAFASLSSKSNSLTLKDVYLKMLLCTNGVTPEKAFEVQKRWKTPLAFIEAFKRMDEKGGGGKEGQKEQMKMVSDEMSNLFGRKKIAKTLSVKISRVWGSVEE